MLQWSIDNLWMEEVRGLAIHWKWLENHGQTSSEGMFSLFLRWKLETILLVGYKLFCDNAKSAGNFECDFRGKFLLDILAFYAWVRNSIMHAHAAHEAKRAVLCSISCCSTSWIRVCCGILSWACICFNFTSFEWSNPNSCCLSLTSSRETC